MNYENLKGGNVTEKIKIYNCDNMELLKQTPDNYFELAIVDPPYGININKSGRLKKYNTKNINWDLEIPTNEYFEELFRVSKNQIIWGGNYFFDYLGSTKCFLTWDKKQPENVSFASCEFAWTSFNTVAKTFYLRPQNQENRIHTTQKPVALYKWLLEKYAKKGDKILDTHLGSGSIAIACNEYGFELTACELDKEYYEKALQRINNHISQQTLF